MRGALAAMGVGRWALLLCGPLGCDAALGIRDLPRASPDASITADAGPVNEACITCDEAKCAEARQQCVAEHGCASLLSCLSRCRVGEVGCRGDCEATHAATAKGGTFVALDRCRREHCSADCYGASGFGTVLDARCACMDRVCAAQMLACVRSGLAETSGAGGCERRLACMGRAPNPDGYVDCIADPMGNDEAADLLDCMRANTCEQCPLATGKTDCVRDYVYGRTRAATATFELRVQDYEEKPIANAVVSACASSGCAACTALKIVPTDGAGDAKLELPMINGGFDGCVTVQSPDHMTTMVFTGRRIHRNEDTLATYLLQPWVFEIYASQLGRTVDPTRGHIIASIHDCLWGRVADAEFNDLGDDSVLGYLDGTTLRQDRMTTTNSGAAAYLNVKPGVHDIVLRRAGVEIARLRVEVAAGRVTDANLFPLSR